MLLKCITHTQTQTQTQTQAYNAQHIIHYSQYTKLIFAQTLRFLLFFYFFIFCYFFWCFLTDENGKDTNKSQHMGNDDSMKRRQHNNSNNSGNQLQIPPPPPGSQHQHQLQSQQSHGHLHTQTHGAQPSLPPPPPPPARQPQPHTMRYVSAKKIRMRQKLTLPSPVIEEPSMTHDGCTPVLSSPDSSNVNKPKIKIKNQKFTDMNDFNDNRNNNKETDLFVLRENEEENSVSDSENSQGSVVKHEITDSENDDYNESVMNNENTMKKQESPLLNKQNENNNYKTPSFVFFFE